MKPNGCEFCNDLRNVEPAKYIGLSDDCSKETKDFFKYAVDNKKFILETKTSFYYINECPKCGYKFTEEDYDSYF